MSVPFIHNQLGLRILSFIFFEGVTGHTTPGGDPGARSPVLGILAYGNRVHRTTGAYHRTQEKGFDLYQLSYCELRVGVNQFIW